MNRRQSLKMLSTLPLLTLSSGVLQSKKSNERIIKPRSLKRGDTVGVIAPATAVTDPMDLQKAQEVMDYFGLKAKFGNNIRSGNGYKTRSIDERLEDLHQMFADKTVKAIFTIRGGYGSMGLLDKIDYDVIKQNPKIFCGYSDITALHLAISKMTGLVTFHSPVLLSKFSDFTTNSFEKAIFNNEPIGLISNPKKQVGIRDTYPILTIKSGKTKGRLTGGNLSLITATLGTPYDIETGGKILFLEDVGEQAYSIDRMLTQLRLAGKFDKAKGIVIGKCEDCSPSGSQNSTWDKSEYEVYKSLLGDLNIPVMAGLMFGHTEHQLTIPYGVMAELNTSQQSLNMLESATF